MLSPSDDARKRKRGPDKGHAEIKRRSPRRKLCPINAPKEPIEWLAREYNGSWWCGYPIPQDVVFQRWPDRRQGRYVPANLAMEPPGHPQLYEGQGVLAHFQAAQIDDVGEVALGSFVEVISSEVDPQGCKRTYVMEVTELFEDTRGQRYFTGHWFYSLWNTALVVTHEGKDGQDPFQEEPIQLAASRLFRSSEHDNAMWGRHFGNVQSLDTIHRKVKVKHVAPGSADPGDCDYWWDQEHDHRFYTFIDKYPPGLGPSALSQPREGPRKLKAVDLLCGCGGMSFVDQHVQDVHIDTQWAVDSHEAMCCSFKVNYPSTKVSCMGVDEWLMMCKKVKQLADQFADWQPSDSDDNGSDEDDSGEQDKNEWELEAILDLRIAGNAIRGKKGQDQGNLLEALQESQCWLEFKVKWKGWCSKGNPDGTTWVHVDCLNCDKLLVEFLGMIRKDKLIPFPGDIDVVMGGPPCQGVSGLNRHAVRIDIRDDSRNRQVEAFYAVVKWFRPSFVLMENVCDTLQKEDGMYAKSAMGCLLEMRYQVRMGIIGACDQGAPQVRNRVFMWGALSGVEQLPPFPEPSCNTSALRRYIPRAATSCLVEFQDTARQNAAPLVPRLGDMLSDLPTISSFSYTEQARYSSDPQTPYQLFLRRPPEIHQRSAAVRARDADHHMQPCKQQQQKALSATLKAAPTSHVEMVGKSFACYKGNVQDKEWHQLVAHYKQQHGAAAARALVQEQAAGSKALYYQIGQEVLGNLKAATIARGPLRDHRSLCCHLDDHLRICAVPKRKNSSFRDLPGVVTHADGSCCVGHQHAQGNVRSRYACPSRGRASNQMKAGPLFPTAGPCPPTAGPPTPTAATKKASKAKAAGRAASKLVTKQKKDLRGAASITSPEPSLGGCPSRTVFLPTGAVMCPAYCTTFKKGRSAQNRTPFGRLCTDDVCNTVVGRAEPHNRTVLHPDQDRVVSIRENMRMQGFPDHFTLVGLGREGKSTSRNATLTDRYQQVGNAVSPCVASALGRCLALAATGAVPATLDCAVVPVPDPALVQCLKESARLGLKTYQEQQALQQTAAAATLHSRSRQLIQPMEPGEKEEHHQDTADTASVGPPAMQQHFQAEEEQHHPNEAATAAASHPCNSPNQQTVTAEEEEHSQEDADMPASDRPGLSLQRQQAEEEERAVSALHASAQLHRPTDFATAEEEEGGVHALLPSCTQLQGAAEAGGAHAKQVAADPSHVACPEAEEEDQRTEGLLHLSLQTPLQLTDTDLFANEAPASTPAVKRDGIQLFERFANGTAQHAGTLHTSNQHSPSQHSTGCFQEEHVFVITPQGTCYKQAGAFAAALPAQGTTQHAAVPTAAEAAPSTAVPCLADGQAAEAGLHHSCQSQAAHNLQTHHNEREGHLQPQCPEAVLQKEPDLLRPLQQQQLLHDNPERQQQHQQHTATVHWAAAAGTQTASLVQCVPDTQQAPSGGRSEACSGGEAEEWHDPQGIAETVQVQQADHQPVHDAEEELIAGDSRSVAAVDSANASDSQYMSADGETSQPVLQPSLHLDLDIQDH